MQEEKERAGGCEGGGGEEKGRCSNTFANN